MFQGSFISEMEWAVFNSLFWNNKWLYWEVSDFYYKWHFFVRQTLLLKYVKLWQPQYKSWFSLIVEKVMPFESRPNMVREVREVKILSLNKSVFR